MPPKKITYTSNGIFPGTRLIGKERYSKLYHYTSLDKFKLIWENKNLKFSEIAGVNDFNEYRKIVSIPITQPRENETLNDNLQNTKALIQIVHKEINKYKQISLTKDYDSYIKGCMSPMMWGHYGDKGKGVCIELDFDKLDLKNKIYHGNIKYTNLIQHAINLPFKIRKTDDVKRFVVQNIKSIFFIKTSDWKGENEYRIISKECDFLNIEKAISAIYVTDHKSDTCFDVENIVNDVVPIRYIHNIGAQGLRLTVLTDTRRYRKQEQDALNNENNILKITRDIKK